MNTVEQLLLNRLLSAMAEYKASDMHLVPGNFPMLRVYGKLLPLSSEQPLTIDFIKKIVDFWLNDEQKTVFNREKEIIFAYTAPNKLRFRISIYYQQSILAVTLKLIPQQIKPFKELNLPKEAEKILTLKRGLVIIAGPTGSGKSTTVASIIEYFNQNDAKRIVTLERPIEYSFINNQSIIEQKEVGQDIPYYAAGLRFLAEEDVDVIVVSEFNSAAIIREALKASISGRLVIVTVSADSLIKALEIIINNFSANDQMSIRQELAEALSAILVQKILPGLQGSPVIAGEILFPDRSARKIIGSGDFDQLASVLDSIQSDNVLAYDRSLVKLVNAGQLKIAVALEEANDREYVQSLINKND